jgi:hypothetical protein
MLVHLMSVQDPDLGVIVATIDEDGEVVATDAARTLSPTNMTPYQEAVDEWARELAAHAGPGHADWLRRMLDFDLDS